MTIHEIPLNDLTRTQLFYRLGFAYSGFGYSQDAARRIGRVWIENPDTESLRKEVARLEAHIVLLTPQQMIT